MKHIGPGDIEIEEIGIDEIFEGILPGSETNTVEAPQTHQEEYTETVVGDPFGFE